MAEVFLSQSDIARRLGVSRSRVGQLDLPDPDAFVGRSAGWREETLKQWVDEQAQRESVRFRARWHFKEEKEKDDGDAGPVG